MTKQIENIEWDAEEYIVQDHNTAWFVGLFVVVALLTFFTVWMQNWTFLLVIVVALAALLIRIFMPPRKIHYKLTKNGLTEGANIHNFSEYRAFGILQENGHYSAVMIPKKRVKLSTKVYFPEQSGEVIVDALGAKLPMEEVKMDFLDKLVKFLRI